MTATATASTIVRHPAASTSLLHQPAVIVLGRDDKGKPHASWFDEAERSPAAKAAALMGMQALTVANDEIRQLAARLPHGRVFASGRAFVPFVKGTLFDELAAHLPDGVAMAPVRLVSSRPASGAAKTTGPAATGGDGDAGDDSGYHDGGEGGEGGETSRPTNWSAIEVGSLVLTTEGPQEGWYEAVVDEAKGDDLFIVRWRDWPDEPKFARHRNQLGLLPSGQLA